MIDVNDRTWLTIRSHLESRLTLLRERNDITVNEQQTARTRGEIAAVKDLLALPELLATRDLTGNLGYEVGSMNDYAVDDDA